MCVGGGGGGGGSQIYMSYVKNPGGEGVKEHLEVGGMFDQSYFNDCFILSSTCKNFIIKVKHNNCRTKS
jgi:hypothetical protein